MKYTLLIATACMAGLSCCHPLPAVPESNHEVVPPKGSTEVEKAWNRTTEHEGNAILPLDQFRRR